MMVLVSVKKVVAVCFLEAAKTSLEQLAEHRLTFSAQGMAGSPDLPRIYGETRRLRDYLARCASGYQDQVELDLSDEDAALLVACCRRYVEVLDLKLVGEQAVAVDERQWLQKKRIVISDWAVELAQKPPLVELPIPHLAPVPTEGVKALSARLNQKLFDSGHQQRIAPAAASASGVSRGAPPLVPAADRASPLAGLWGDASDGADSSQPKLLDPNRVRDPRLRALVALDLKAYERSIASQDLRLAAVLLSSILEAAVVDHVIPRRATMGVQSTPDTWLMHEVLAKIMGDQLQPQDKTLCYHLFTARNLLRPALQMTTPTVVTAASLERFVELAKRALHAMGYAS
jgi:hypothetical protein